MEFVDVYLLVLLLGLQCLLVYLFIDTITDFVLYYYSYLAFRRAIVGTDCWTGPVLLKFSVLWLFPTSIKFQYLQV